VTRSGPPVELTALLVFSALVSAYDLLGLVDAPFIEDLHRATVPYTGWLASFPYMFLLYSLVTIWRRNSPASALLGMRKYAILILLIAVGLGLAEGIRKDRLSSDPNPYLQHAPLRPLYTVVLPLAWAAALLSPRITRYISAAEPR
jgi:hypothetical protein